MLTTLSGWRKPASSGREGGLADSSLVVATYRRSEEVVALLGQLQLVPDVPSEVVIVDGSPDDDTARAVAAWAGARELAFELVYVRSPAGLTRQRNVGIDASRGEIVFFLDDDCRPEPGYFRAIHEVYANDASGRVGAVCGSPVNEMGRPMSLRWRVRLKLGIAPRGQMGEYLRMGASMPTGTAVRFAGSRRVDAMPGCVMSFRRAVLERHRFSRFFYGYSQGEDLEMSLRVGRDHDVLWCGDAHAIHDHAPGGRPASMEKGRMEVRNRFFIWKRHVPDARLLERLRFWSDTAYSIALDIVAFVTRPTSLARLRHAAGCLLGMVECIAAPSPSEEPPAEREYEFDLLPFAPPQGARSLSAGSGGAAPVRGVAPMVSGALE